MANLGGLARAMVRDGVIENVNDLKDFMLGFTQAKASFDFVDVGYGKERADSKIKGSKMPIFSSSSSLVFLCARHPLPRPGLTLELESPFLQRRLGGICRTTTAARSSWGCRTTPVTLPF